MSHWSLMNSNNNNDNNKNIAKFLQVSSRRWALSYIFLHGSYPQQPTKVGATIIPHFIGMGAETLLNNLAPSQS